MPIDEQGQPMNPLNLLNLPQAGCSPSSADPNPHPQRHAARPVHQLVSGYGRQRQRERCSRRSLILSHTLPCSRRPPRLAGGRTHPAARTAGRRRSEWSTLARRKRPSGFITGRPCLLNVGPSTGCIPERCDILRSHVVRQIAFAAGRITRSGRLSIVDYFNIQPLYWSMLSRVTSCDGIKITSCAGGLPCRIS
jgi:hypothetical protein